MGELQSLQENGPDWPKKTYPQVTPKPNKPKGRTRMNKNVDAGAVSEVAGVASGAHTTSGVDAHAQHDYRSARVDDFVKDLGVDELGMLAGAARADQAQLMFMTTYMNQQTLGMAAAWQAMRHFEADENQRLRHADTMQSMTAAVVGEMVEAIANKVCDKMRAG